MFTTLLSYTAVDVPGSVGLLHYQLLSPSSDTVREHALHVLISRTLQHCVDGTSTGCLSLKFVSITASDRSTQCKVWCRVQGALCERTGKCVHMLGFSSYVGSPVSLCFHIHEVVESLSENLILLWTIKHTAKTLDNSMQRFTHHGLCQTYKTVKHALLSECPAGCGLFKLETAAA